VSLTARVIRYFRLLFISGPLWKWNQEELVGETIIRYTEIAGNGSVLFSADILPDDDIAATFITDMANSNQEDVEDAKIRMNSLCLGVTAQV
jgi:hypothetical protein